MTLQIHIVDLFFSSARRLHIMAQANVQDFQATCVTGVNGVKCDAADSNYDIEAIVIGAGFSGLRMLYELRKRGISGKLFESGTGVGGV